MSSARLKRPLEDYARIVFDCDGVILDSNRLKSDAMGDALTDEPDECRQAFVAYHREHGGVSRYVKFAHYFENMYPDPDAEARTRDALVRYASLVQKGLQECDELPGLRPLLARIEAGGLACFVNSGGDEEEVRAALTERGLAPYFAAIFGSPKTKPENMTRIAAIDNGMPGLFFGDARSDFEAAAASGFDFVFVTAKSEWQDGPAFCAEHGIPMVATPGELATLEPECG